MILEKKAPHLTSHTLSIESFRRRFVRLSLLPSSSPTAGVLIPSPWSMPPTLRPGLGQPPCWLTSVEPVGTPAKVDLTPHKPSSFSSPGSKTTTGPGICGGGDCFGSFLTDPLFRISPRSEGADRRGGGSDGPEGSWFGCPCRVIVGGSY